MNRRLYIELALIISLQVLLIAYAIFSFRLRTPIVARTIAYAVFMDALILANIIWDIRTSGRSINIIVKGNIDDVRTMLGSLFDEGGLKVIWSGRRHGTVYPGDAVVIGSRRLPHQRSIATISVGEVGRKRVEVKMEYDSDIRATGFFGFKMEHRKFKRITANIKRKLYTVPSTKHVRDRRPPEPVEDPLVRYIAERRKFSIAKNVYCPNCSYEFTAHSVANSPKVKGGRTRCPKCNLQFNYTMAKQVKRRPRRTTFERDRRQVYRKKYNRPPRPPRAGYERRYPGKGSTRYRQY